MFHYGSPVFAMDDEDGDTTIASVSHIGHNSYDTGDAFFRMTDTPQLYWRGDNDEPALCLGLHSIGKSYPQLRRNYLMLASYESDMIEYISTRLFQ